MRQAISGVLAAAVAFVVTGSVPVLAGGSASTSCNSTIIGGTFGSLVVPNGATCKLAEVHVAGDVVVQPGGALQLHIVANNVGLSGNTIDGDVKSLGARWINAGFPPGNKIGGNLVVAQTTGVPLGDPASDDQALANYFCRTAIGGTVKVDNNLAAAKFNLGSSEALNPSLGIAGCGPSLTVGRSVIVAGNLGEVWVSDNGAITGGGITRNLSVRGNALVHVFRNNVGGTLACRNNASIDGGGNTAAKKTGQCAGF